MDTHTAGCAEGGQRQPGRSSRKPGNVEGPAAERREAPPAASLPCLLVTTQPELARGEGEDKAVQVNKLLGSHKRSAQCLSLEIIGLAKQFGLERLGFLTLTFVENVYDIREANRRFNSLNTHVIKDRYERAIAVVERQERGAVHFHLLVVAASDIRTGSDFEAFKRRDYRSANPALRAEWAFWRATCSKYGFGRHELLPVRSTAEGIARYVASYIGKHIRARNEGDKGARLVRYIGYGVGDRKASPQFAWAYGNGWLWRHKLAAWATRHGARDASELSRIFGPRWAYALQAWILAEELPGGLVCPSFLVANRSIDTCVPVWLARSKADKVKEGMTFNRCYDLDKDKLWTAKQANR